MDTIFGIHVVTLIFLCGLCTTGVTVSCIDDPPQTGSILETDPPGTVIFSQPGSPFTEWVIYNITAPAKIWKQLLEYFRLDNNATAVTLSVNKTVDLEAIHELWGVELQVITFQLDCKENGTETGGRKELFVTVGAVNEFDPEFIGAPFTINVTEDTTVGTSVFKLIDHARDRDVNPGQREISFFSLLKYSIPEFDGRTHFAMNNVQDGIIAVSQILDYEPMPYKYYDLNISVQDTGGRSALTVMKINIMDADDQDPEFFTPDCPKDCYTYYETRIDEAFMGPLENITPSEIRARDRDKAINNSIIYTIKGTNPSGLDLYFSQDRRTGEVNVTMPLNDTDKTLTSVVIFLQAAEDSLQGRSTGTTFQIEIERFFSTTEGTTATTEQITEAERVQTAGGGNISMIVLIVLACVAFILAVSFVIAVILFKKKYGRNRLVGPDDSPTGSEKETDVEDLSMEGQEQWPATGPNQFNGLPTTGRGQQLPSLKDTGTGTEVKKKSRRSRRRKKEKDTQEFDGTRDYEGSVNPEFYGQRKSRVKQSSRSKQQTDPRYWITVDNDY